MLQSGREAGDSPKVERVTVSESKVETDGFARAAANFVSMLILLSHPHQATSG